MTLEDIAAVADSAAARSAVSFHLKQTDRPQRALDTLFDVLGDHPSISEVDLVIDGKRVGTLTKEALFGLVEDRTMKIGDGAQGALPGDPAPSFVRLHCPAPNCDQRAIVSPDLYANPPTCSLHDCAMVVDEGR
jgi:hypothetical protein